MKKEKITIEDALHWLGFVLIVSGVLSACASMFLAIYVGSIGGHEAESFFWFYSLFGWFLLAAPGFVCESIADSRERSAYYTRLASTPYPAPFPHPTL